MVKAAEPRPPTVASGMFMEKLPLTRLTDPILSRA
jgi:hypothetical protein